jgi:UDP-3-O-[3-hydroxymyristoyl] glucosamine N-acyltransferase
MQNVYIHDRTVIGENVEIESGARIGIRGLALERYGDHNEKFRMKEYVGRVILNDYVHVGANTCVERGVTGDTIVGYGTKIDVLCCIGHDVVIGSNCRITALCCIAGYVKMGNNVFVGVSTAIRNRITVGDNAYIGMGSLIVKDVPANVMVYGRPPHLTVRPLRSVKGTDKST